MKHFPVPEVYDALELIMKYYPMHFDKEAKTEIEVLLNYCINDLDDDSEKLLATLFIKALKNHIGPISVDEHIYLKKYDLPQIKLFDLIISHFPFVSIGHRISNTLLADAAGENAYVAMLDIGIGRGVQTIHFLDELQRRQNKSLEHVTIVGVEPFTEAIDAAEKNIREKAQDLPFNVSFIPVNRFVEDLNFSELSAAVPKSRDILIANASLALHHIQHSDERDRFLADLAQLKPSAFILTEPNVNHFEPDFFKRFQNSYQHFYHVFSVIDNLDISSKERNALKIFFGREINDIIGQKDGDRYERHEPAQKWAERLTKAGFQIQPLDGMNNDYTAKGISLESYRSGFLGFKHKEEVVLSVFNAKAR